MNAVWKGLVLWFAATGVAHADDANSAWTTELITRPLTVKAGTIAVRADLETAQNTVTEMDMTSTETSLRLVGTAGYGVIDRLELGASYVLGLRNVPAKGPLGVYGLFAIKDDEQLKLAPGASFDYDLDTKAAVVHVGVAARYALTPRLAVFAPPGQLRVTIAGQDVSVPGAVVLKPTDVTLPVGLGLQGTANIFASLQTNLATIDIRDSSNAFLFKDVIPLIASLFYSPSNAIDLGASLVVKDVADIADVFAIVISARLFVL